MIQFRCACNRWLRVEDDLAGRLVECTKCGAQSRVPEARTLSGPEVLAAAMRQVNQPADDELPTAEVVEGSEEAAAPPADGLEALAQVVKSAPALKAGARGPQPAARVRRPAGTSPRSALSTGRLKPVPAAGKGFLSPTAIGVIGGAAAFLLLIVILIVFGGGGEAPKNEPPPKAPLVVEAPKPKRFTGHQPGELFRGVPYEDEKQAEQTPPAEKKP